MKITKLKKYIFLRMLYFLFWVAQSQSQYRNDIKQFHENNRYVARFLFWRCLIILNGYYWIHYWELHHHQYIAILSGYQESIMDPISYWALGCIITLPGAPQITDYCRFHHYTFMGPTCPAYKQLHAFVNMNTGYTSNDHLWIQQRKNRFTCK